MVWAAECNINNDTLVFRMMHGIVHEMAHCWVSYLSYHCNALGYLRPRLDTPPGNNFNDPYGYGQLKGEAGFWLEDRIFGGMVFYEEWQNHEVSATATSCPIMINAMALL